MTRWKDKWKNRPGRWNRRNVILLLERLDLYISSGLAVDRALAIAQEGMAPRQRSSIEAIRLSVLSGGLVSDALERSVRISPTIGGLIRHGEGSGGLARALGASRSLLEREDELFKKCMSALAYPAIIGIFAALLTIGLVRGVMPQIIPMLESLHAQLPFLTRAVIFLSRNFLAYGLYGLAGAVAIGATSAFAYRKIMPLKRFSHICLMKTPIVGGLVSSYSLSVFLTSYGSLVDSGIPSDEAYADAVTGISLLPLQNMFRSEIPRVRRGIGLGSIFNGGFSRRLIPSYVAPLLAAGEASGMLGPSALRAAAILDRDIEHMLKRLTALIEPVMMAGMGCAVGAIALSIMMPIYDISKALQK